jgi:3-hydroxyisobutyrate dehydrogenase-like beta-hydroxyacid dehydrogenase
MRVGFIGLGTMGGRMVGRLVGAGQVPVVYDRVAAASERAAALGATRAGSVAEVVRAADVVLSSLPMPADVEEVYLGPGGARDAARPGQVVADLSTIDPATARRVGSGLGERGVGFLDAPVSGGPSGAENGTLVVMVGGEAAALETARPLLEAFSRRIVHVGPVGAGSTIKLANQLLVGVNALAAMEAATFASRAGIPPATALEVLSAGAGDSVQLRRAIREFILTGDFRPQFALRLLVKDLRLLVAEAAGLGATLVTAPAQPRGGLDGHLRRPQGRRGDRRVAARRPDPGERE